MSAPSVYHQVEAYLNLHLPGLSGWCQARLAALVTGILVGGSVAPARIAAALHSLGLSHASAESIERRIRRIENDPTLTAASCLHPFARHHLCLGRPERLLVALDATTQENRVVMLTASVCYRGRSLPLAWVLWPANVPLVGDGFWARVAALLAIIAPLLPKHVPVVWLADRAFGTPRFTDLLQAYGWDYVVRTQAQTRYQDACGHERSLSQVLRRPGQRCKGRGRLYKKLGWRDASFVSYWGRRHHDPLHLVSSLPPGWSLIALYRRRYAIETTFRDFKSSGWEFEQGQVVNLTHLDHLLVGMALALWLAVLLGVAVADRLLAGRPSGQRRTRPYPAKFSLFQLGLQAFQAARTQHLRLALHAFTDWDAPNWSFQLTQHHARAFVFAPSACLNPVRP